MLKVFLVVAVLVAAVQATAKCSHRDELHCMTKFSQLEKVKGDKEKICGVYYDVAMCFVKSHCIFKKYANLFKAMKEACDNQCDLAKMVTCKLDTYKEIRKEHGSFCKEQDKFEKCFDNTNCDNLKKVEGNFIKNYCGSCLQKQVSCLKSLKGIQKFTHNKTKMCSLFEETTSCLDKTGCHLDKITNLIKAVETSCETECDLSAVLKCQFNLDKKLNITQKNVCQKYHEFDVCYENTKCDELSTANKQFMFHFCNKLDRSST